MGMYEGLALELKDQVIAELKQALAEKDREIDCLSEQVNVLNAKCCLMEDELDIDLPAKEKAFVVDLQRRLRLGYQFTKRDCVRVLKLLRRKHQAYQQLMRTAFRFAIALVGNIANKDEIEKEAIEFLDSPEAEVWKE